MPTTAVIEAVGHYLPQARQTNDELAEEIDTSDAWISTRTGISARAKAAADEPTSVLAAAAARAALSTARRGDPVDTVIVATTTPDMKCPATAPIVADALGLSGVASFDVNSACTGFLAGLASARGLVESGGARTVLLVGADKYSSIVHPRDRATAPIFGDGAAALLLRRGDRDEPGALGRVHLGSDGALALLAHVKAGGSLLPVPVDGSDPLEGYLRMDGRATYRHAVEKMVEWCRRCLDDAALTAADVDLLVAHQANARILRQVARELAIDERRAVVDLADIGNTAAASIPMALSRAHAAGRLRGGERLLLAAFGAGASWGATTLTWPDLHDNPAPTGGTDDD